MTKLTDNSELNIKVIKNLAGQQFLDLPYFAQLTVAQAILESDLEENQEKHKGKGGSELAIHYCNLFGQKPGFITKGTNGLVSLSTHEVYGGKDILVNALFLSNKEIEDSLEQHKKLLTEVLRYANLKDCKSFKAIAYEVSTDGYATDPQYVLELMRIWNTHNLGDL